MVVAILDDGICLKEISTPTDSYCIGKCVNRDKAFKNPKSHATVCAKIIEKNCTPDKFLNVAFIGEKESTSISDMVDALVFSLDKKIDIICMSNGIELFDRNSENYKKLFFVCEALKQSGVRIYAAQSNSGRQTIPALFSSTISVETFRLLDGIMRIPYRRSDLYTNGDRITMKNSKPQKVVKCNSYACAYAVSLAKTKLIFSPGILTYDPSVCIQRKIMKKGKVIGYRIFNRLNRTEEGTVFLEQISFLKKLRMYRKGRKFFCLDYGMIPLFIMNLVSRFYKKTEIPVIQIQRSPQGSALAMKIADYFSSNSYLTTVLSVNKSDYLNGAVYIPESIICSYINYFADKYENDVLIAVMDQCDQEDICIKATSDGYIIYFGNGTKRIKRFADLIKIIIHYYQ